MRWPRVDIFPVGTGTFCTNFSPMVVKRFCKTRSRVILRRTATSYNQSEAKVSQGGTRRFLYCCTPSSVLKAVIRSYECWDGTITFGATLSPPPLPPQINVKRGHPPQTIVPSALLKYDLLISRLYRFTPKTPPPFLPLTPEPRP